MWSLCILFFPLSIIQIQALDIPESLLFLEDQCWVADSYGWALTTCFFDHAVESDNSHKSWGALCSSLTRVTSNLYF